MLLSAEGLCFRYPHSSQPLLTDMHFRLASGQRLGLMAPSGLGKTTLCRLLAGYEQPSGGRVLLDGRPLSAYRGPCPVQWLSQQPGQMLNPQLKIGRILREAWPVTPHLRSALGIDEAWLQRYPGQLSGGEQQRICIARALGPQTRFLLADEITAMLDLVSQAQLWQLLLAEAHSRDLGLLIVSHDQALLRTLCDSIQTLSQLTGGEG